MGEMTKWEKFKNYLSIVYDYIFNKLYNTTGFSKEYNGFTKYIQYDNWELCFIICLDDREKSRIELKTCLVDEDGDWISLIDIYAYKNHYDIVELSKLSFEEILIAIKNDCFVPYPISLLFGHTVLSSNPPYDNYDITKERQIAQEYINKILIDMNPAKAILKRIKNGV